MKFDRNTILGFTLLAALLFGYFYYTNKEQAAYRQQQAIADSIANASKPRPDTLAQKIDSVRADSMNRQAKAGSFKGAADGVEQITEVETDLLRIAFTNKGGQPKWVELKKFKNMDSGHVRLAADTADKITYAINTGNNQSAQTADLYFQPAQVVKNEDGSFTVSFLLSSADSAAAATVQHQYTIRPGDYMLDFDIALNGNSLLTGGVMNLNWEYTAAQQESDLSFEKQNTQIGYVEDGEFDYHTIGRRSSVGFSAPVKWLGVRQRFFNTFLIAKDNFTSGKINWVIPDNNEKIVGRSAASMRVEMPADAKVGFSLLYGPSDYHTLTRYDLRMGKIVNLGQGPYAFVRPLNKYVVIPVWDFIKNFVSNYGWVIAFLTLFIRLLISPLTYKSYLSGAKMKALRPEIAALREKYGKDQQAMSMEQMKLFREAGVNPLGGCIPALLQIPIFFALYSFFSSSVDLRGAGFLWANDLSAFDDVIKFGVHIPLLGSHLSLFTITAVLTSLAISLYSMSMTPDQSNPILKYMPYIFPVFLLFIFNQLPSALTWYYTVSNIITLILQFVIQNYIIDHNKILARIAENRKKPKTKSKWQERLEQMQEQQKKMKESQQKSRR
ncbi:MAG TPA: membrane protein insertase YidC [Chitinophagaceae bacterium]|nr:membrane protein insertase YidC [Chitinophagaceae bacterium]